MLLTYLQVFLVGGLICGLSEILIVRTKLMPARILVILVVLGVILQGAGIYEPIYKFGKAGATVPLIGFGRALAKGAIEGVNQKGLIGAITGGLTATAAGITAAIVFAYIMAMIFNHHYKK
ncbi:MAG: stage V sporulation protein AE [Clostridia bacterium]|jgi:stage V sporulation protein AE|nr:stage V sporulation protein AE [Clostridia bacterium]MDD4275476.1 stage V sporulation protein AE [Clostridia bacterium]